MKIILIYFKENVCEMTSELRNEDQGKSSYEITHRLSL